VVVVFVVIVVKKPAAENLLRFLSLNKHITYFIFLTVKYFFCPSREGTKGIRGVTPLFLKLGTRWKLVVNFTLWPLLPLGKNIGTL
jgi:hypothetical protein